MLKKSIAFLLIPASLFLSHQAFSASCSIADYSADYTISINCDELTLTQAYSNELTIDANISNTGIAIDASSYALKDLSINIGANVSNTLSAKSISYSTLVYGTIINDGTISATQQTIDLDNGASLTTLSNTANGTITSTGNSSAVYLANSSTISSLSNAGNIQGDVTLNNSTITTFENTGTINSTGYAVYSVSGTISTLTNTGTLDGTVFDIFMNSGSTLTTFNNDQGASGSDPVRYNRIIPTNYNIIINSTSDYGQVVFYSVIGTTNFGVHSTSSVDTSATYSSVIDGLTLAELNNTTTGTVTLSGTSYTWTLTDTNGDAAWDLNFATNGPSAADTQTSIQAIKGQLQGNLNSLTAGANFANMNTYDCNFFDSKGGCFSFGNRFTDVQSPSMQTNSFVATGGYKINNHFRIAGFIDQNLNNNTAHNIDIENKGPLVGLIGVWNQNANQLGWQIKVANAYQSKDASIKRSVTGTSEAGSGKTDIDSQSYVAEFSYNYAATSSLLLRPYVALRYALVKQEGYTETGVDNPLTYNSIRDRSKTALVGVKVKKRLTDKVVARGSMGLEHDLSHKTDNLEASGVSGLTSESFSNNLDKTRPVASLGADYYIDQTQRLSVNAFYQELPFASTKSRTLYINYMLGF